MRGWREGEGGKGRRWREGEEDQRRSAEKDVLAGMFCSISIFFAPYFFLFFCPIPSSRPFSTTSTSSP